MNGFFTLLLLSSYDWYHPVYGSVLMYIGIVWSLLNVFYTRVAFKPKDLLYVIVLCAIPLFSPLGVGAYVALLGGLFLLTARTSFIDKVVKSSGGLLALHLWVFYTLFFLSFAGIYINVFDFFGFLPQRTHYAYNYRPSGLLLEPNSYCVMILLLSYVCHHLHVSVRSITKVAAIVSILLSQSLWGLVIIPLMVSLNFGKKGILWFFTVATPVVVLFLGFFLSSVDRIQRGLAGD